MKPTSIHTICIGDEMPLMVRLAIDHNRELLVKNGIDYVIHQVPRDKKKYPCAGFQAEVLKLQLLSALSNIVVADWDIWLDYVPDLPCSSHIFFGFRKCNGPDFFITYCNDLMMKQLFTDMLETEHKYRGGSPGFTKVFADRLMQKGIVREFPYDSYCHLCTSLGLMNVIGEYGDIDSDRKFRTEKKALNSLVSWNRSRGLK